MRQRALTVCSILVLGLVKSEAQAANIPQTVGEALANLRYSYAPAADWEGFQPGSSVTHRRTGRGSIAGAYQETVKKIMTSRDSKALRFIVVVNDQSDPWLPAETDRPELDASRAIKVGEEDVYVGKRLIHTEIYRFEYLVIDREYQHLFWLAPNVPDGVVRHRRTVNWDPTYTSRSETNLTDVAVTLKAGTGTVRGYCLETIEGLRGGKVSRGKICKSSQVPGALVSGEQREMDGTKEVGYVQQILETFEAVR